jgi:hypothetical protein
MAGADTKLELPGSFEKGKTYLLTGETLLAWREALLKDRAIPGPGITETQTEQGRLFTAAGGVGNTIFGNSPGEFWDLFELGEPGSGDWRVRGGTVRVSGKKTIKVPDYVVNTGTDGEKVLYIEVPVKINRTTDEQWPLPDLKDTNPESLDELDIEDATDWPAGTKPEISDGLGIVILPVGRLIVTDGVPRFIPTGFGMFYLTHCFLNLGYRPRP